MSLSTLLERLQERIHELEEELEALGRRELAALHALGAAHDANNLLAIARLSLAAWRDDGGSGARAETVLAVDRAAALCRSVLRLSRRGAGARAVDLPALVQRIVPLAERLARHHEVTIEAACGPIAPLHADELELERILLNLVWNAIQHSPARGIVRIHAHEDDAAHACLRVIDHGPGMGASAPREDGHGIGLSVVRLLVARASGRFELDTHAGGTTARVRLPLAAREDSLDDSLDDSSDDAA
jgi:signal transduction histidine kinase